MSASLKSFDESSALARAPLTPDFALGADCGNVPYQLNLLTEDEHIFFLANPDQDSNDCPSIMLHDLGNGKLLEEVLDTENSMHFPLGDFSLEELLEAHEDVQLDSEIGYDVLHNNCMTYAILFLDNMNMPVTQGITDFVMAGIIHGGDGKTIKALREHPEFETIFPDGANQDDEALLKALGDMYMEMFAGHGIVDLN